MNPACQIIGIEPDEGAAKLAAQSLDRVLCGKFEDFNLESEGIALGSVDTVVAADVLEHMYDPWHAMTPAEALLVEGCADYSQHSQYTEFWPDEKIAGRRAMDL